MLIQQLHLQARASAFHRTSAGKASQKTWERLRAERISDTCAIMGNGPSLRHTDFQALREIPVFGLNKVHLLAAFTDLQPTYVVAVNPLVIEQSRAELIASPADLFVAKGAGSRLHGTRDLCLLPAGAVGSFARTARAPFWEGYTVTYVALQIAYVLGFRKVVLVGVDHRFRAAATGEPNQTVVAGSRDEDHFHPSYFSGGVSWQLPDLVNSERSYDIARKAFQDDGRSVIDATVGGALTVFPKQALRDALLV